MARVRAYSVPDAGILATEGALPILAEEAEPNVFLELVPVVAFPPVGGPDMDPAGCRVHGTGAAPGLDEGLDEHQGNAPDIEPSMA